jgi:hypothetical protein
VLSSKKEQSQPPAIIPPEEPVEGAMNEVIYLVGLIVVVMAILSFFGLR